MRLKDTMSLLKAEIYANPANKGDFLPVVMGDFLSDDATTAASDAGGVIPAVLVDRLNAIYLINALPSYGAVDASGFMSRESPDYPLVYLGEDDVLQSKSVYTYRPDVDLEGKGHAVSVLQFTVNPGTRRVSTRFKGTKNITTGALIINPIEAIKHVFTQVGNWIEADFDPVSINLAILDTAKQGYRIHWPFLDERTYEQWMIELFIHYFASLHLTPDGKVAITIDIGERVTPEQLLLHAAMDLDDPTLDVEWSLERRNIATELKLEYQYAWHRGEYRKHETITHASGMNQYGLRTKTFQLPGMRTDIHRDGWQKQFFFRHIRPALNYEGTSEIQRVILAKALLGRDAAKETS